MEILSVAEMRALERAADARGLSYAQMMQNAGQGAAQIIHQRLGVWGITRPRILVLVGPGNNGGDGLVCATALANAGLTVQCYLLRPRPEDDPVYLAARAAGLFMADAQNDMRLRVLHQMITHANVIVDALLGTGVSRPIEGDLRAILREVGHRRRATNLPPCKLIALDGVTGMNYDTGSLDPAAVPADLTITFHAPKRGHYCFPAAQACGELIVTSIGIEPDVVAGWRASAQCSNVRLADEALVRARLPARQRDAHKGAFGRVLVIGGCSEYLGAPALAARAAYRVGAGLVALAVPDAVKPSAAATCPEAIFLALPESSTALAPPSQASIVQWLASAPSESVVLLGPGLGQAAPTATFLDALLESLTDGLRGLVCDADALNLLARIPAWWSRLPSQTVLTPHPGEMARLMQRSTSEVQGDRIECALRCAEAWGRIVVLKGAHTVIAAPGQHSVVLPFANPALATAGSGDVLAGCIAGFMAQGLAPFDAAVCGAYVHGAAGEQWRAQHGNAGLLAGELTALIPDVIHALSA
jgi:NAD(P)H-hydrate epimerase